ncbi:hypothetical protein OSSY52_17830 [Tepiditoga spiralis]|uniref:Uncharacterized protein n=1 Tax=Tepiditoga spiralis TaxID=2108365 RepID=A0A7G1GBA8_9BACT|nr:hypothetical protein [Tepiditoga spiralis]BBE31642.1 hypothetical protein OSSY52_17830 [Tepiditoga spiralis]
MSKIYLSNRRKSSKKWPLFLIIILILVIGFFGVKYYMAENASETKYSKLTYTFSYKDNLYFIRVLNDSKKIFMVKTIDNITFPDSFLTLSKNNLQDTTNNFLRGFNLQSDLNYYINLNDDLIKSFINKIGSNKSGINGFFEGLMYRNSSIFDFLTVDSYYNLIKKYDRSTNLTSPAVYVLLKSFSKYSINNFDKLTLKPLFDKPIKITIDDKIYYRNYLNEENFKRLKEILE